MSSNERWEELISAFESSGKKQRDFCAEYDISHNQLTYWRKKLRPDSIRPRFQKVPRVGTASNFEVVTPMGVTVRVPEGFHAESLKRLLDVLR